VGAVVHGAPRKKLLALCVVQAHAQRSRPTGIPIYSASTETEAEFHLELKALEMGCTLSEHKPGRGGHDFCRVIPVCVFPEDIRKIISTTNAIESLNMTLRHP
jgi:hypothetical protein